MLDGLCAFLEVLGENLLPRCLQLLEAAHFSWLMALFHPLQSQQYCISDHSSIVTTPSDCLPSYFLFKDIRDVTGLIQIIQDDLSVLKSVDYQPSFLLSCKQRIQKFQRLRHGHLWGKLFCSMDILIKDNVGIKAEK